MTHIANACRAVLLLGAVLLLAACGSSDSGSDTTAAAATGTTAASAFPAEVVHRFGTTTVPAKPTRIAVVGLTEQDTVLALGETPIATTEWYGEQPSAVWPWAQEALGDARPTVLRNTDGFEFEKIAGLKPDLILGTNAGMREADYEKLSAIAPTIAAPKGGTDYFSRWDEQVLLIAAAMGEDAKGRALVEGVRERFAAAAASYPELRGKTATFAQNAFYDGEIYVYPDGLNTEFLTYLGLEINPQVTALAKTPGEQVPVSAERLDVLDADVALFATERASDVPALEKVPTFGALDVVARNRSVFTDGTLAGALYFMTPLSLDYVVERLPQQLAAAAAGRAPRRVLDSSEPAAG